MEVLVKDYDDVRALCRAIQEKVRCDSIVAERLGVPLPQAAVTAGSLANELRAVCLPLSSTGQAAPEKDVAGPAGQCDASPAGDDVVDAARGSLGNLAPTDDTKGLDGVDVVFRGLGADITSTDKRGALGVSRAAVRHFERAIAQEIAEGKYMPDPHEPDPAPMPF